MLAPQSARSALAVTAALFILNGCANKATEVSPSPTNDRAAEIASIVAAGQAIEAAQDAPYDPVAFEAQLKEARKPYDKCVDDKISEFRAKPIADKTVAVNLLLGECNPDFKPVSDLIFASPVANMPTERQEAVDRVVGDARKRAETALGAP